MIGIKATGEIHRLRQDSRFPPPRSKVCGGKSGWQSSCGFQVGKLRLSQIVSSKDKDVVWAFFILFISFTLFRIPLPPLPPLHSLNLL